MVSDWKQKDKDALVSFLNGLLKEGIVSLTFKKKDGTIREMNATLKEDLVKNYERKTDRERKVSNEVMAVFDVDLQEWRSFNINCITEIRGSLL